MGEALRLDGVPASIRAPIFDENDFKVEVDLGRLLRNSLHKLGHNFFSLIDRADDAQDRVDGHDLRGVVFKSRLGERPWQSILSAREATTFHFPSKPAMLFF